MIKHAWSSLLIPSNELRLDMTLLCGQTFVWQRLIQKEYTSYFGVVENTVVELKESKDDVEFRQIQFDKTTLAPETLRTNLHKLFNYDARFNLPKMHAHFAKCDPKFYARVYTYYPGVRVIQQEPLECLISFICSSNNNVARITLMITRLCAKYGSLIGTLDEEGNTLSFFKFPTLDQLSTATEEELK
jgi:N-glycosylase/DNA lyase